MNFPATGPNIVIVEDREDLRAQLRECIRSAVSACTIFEESDPEATKLLLEKQATHLLIMDARMVRAGDMAVLRAIPTLGSDRRPQFVFLISETFTAPPVYSPRARVVPFPIPLALDTLAEQIRVRLLPKAPIPQPPKIDMQVFTVFERAISLVFKKLVGFEISRSRAYIRKTEMLTGDLGSVLQLKSPYFDGHLALVMNKPLFLFAVNQILGAEFPAVTEENVDAIAEICNQIYGFSKRELNGIGFHLEPAIPEIVRGEKCSFPPSQAQQLHICMEFTPASLVPDALAGQKVMLEIQLNDLTKLNLSREPA